MKLSNLPSVKKIGQIATTGAMLALAGTNIASAEQGFQGVSKNNFWAQTEFGVNNTNYLSQNREESSEKYKEWADEALLGSHVKEIFKIHEANKKTELIQKNLEVRAYIEKHLAVGEITECYFYKPSNGAFYYKDDNGIHLFNPKGEELTKNAIGKVIESNYYSSGACYYEDDNGFHLFDPKGEELTKNAIGKVTYCSYNEDTKTYLYADDNLAHSFSLEKKNN